MATIRNLFIDGGTTYSNIISVAGSTGSALNLTGYTVASQIRKSYSSSIAYDFTSSIYDAEQGKIRLQLSSAQTEQIPSGRWLYDVEITSPSGNKTRVLEGIVTVTPEVTKI